MPKQTRNRASIPKKDRKIERTREVGPEQAYNEARDLLSLPDNPTFKSIEERHSMFPNLDKKMGDRVLTVAALRLSGKWDKEITEEMDIPGDACQRLDRRHPEEMALAEAHCIKMAQHKMNVNTYRVRAAAARRAESMLNVLCDLAESKDTKDNIRRQCAVDVLALLGMSDSYRPVGGDGQLKRSASIAIQNVINQEKASTVTIDAEDAEFVEETNV